MSIIYIEETMKKKTERFSLKKIAPNHHKNDSRVNQQIKNHVEKTKSQGKNKSHQKITMYPNQKFKILKNGQRQRQRIKTQADEGSIDKNYNPRNINFKKKDKNQKLKIKAQISSRMPQKKVQSGYIQGDNKQKKNKKLCINPDLIDLFRGTNSSLEKVQYPLTCKNQRTKKQIDSNRSGHKKTALESYISESLESLQYPKKKKIVNQRISDVDKTLLKEKKNKIKDLAFDQVRHEIIKQEKNPKGNYISKKNLTQKDESIEKIQIKFQKRKKNIYDLSREQIQIFGDRFPEGFDKIKLLGRGGFSLVWLGQHKKNKKKYAIKQIITQSTHQTHVKQIWFGTYFFQFGGKPKKQFENSPGIKNLVKLYYYFINKKDTWILYQKCGDSLGNALYELKGEQIGSQKCYRIFYKPLYNRIRKNQNQLRTIILEVAQALQLLAQNNIVHSDLKTENILVRTKPQQEIKNAQISIAETKLIDYGSSFVFNNLRQFSMATPEYMAPQILNFILYQNQMEYIPKLYEYVQKYRRPWVIDVWSLGCVLLEIISGIPLWMSLKTLVRKKSTDQIKYGLFAIKGRLFDKIIRRQIQVVQNLQYYLSQENYSGIILQQDLKVLLKKMLALNPQKRISPSEIISFLETSMNILKT